MLQKAILYNKVVESTVSKIAIISYQTLNIGDEIQSLATKKLVESLGYSVDLMINREALKDFQSDEDIKLICNGWFMEEPSNWPPSDNITPLFISMHISHEFDSAKLLADKNLLPYYKSQRPIGCRDYHTLNLLKKAGIPAYFSGCMTLTYQNTYQTRTNQIVLADPFYRLRPLSYEKYVAEKLIPCHEKENIFWVTHKGESRAASQNERYQKAEHLLQLYGTAKLVITSRMHAALTCLALNTPVIFIHSGYETKAANNRFDGLLSHIHIIPAHHFPLARKTPLHFIGRVLKLYKHSKKLRPLNIDWDAPSHTPKDLSHITEKIKTTINDFLAHPN